MITFPDFMKVMQYERELDPRPIVGVYLTQATFEHLTLEVNNWFEIMHGKKSAGENALHKFFALQVFFSDFDSIGFLHLGDEHLLPAIFTELKRRVKKDTLGALEIVADKKDANCYYFVWRGPLSKESKGPSQFNYIYWSANDHYSTNPAFILEDYQELLKNWITESLNIEKGDTPCVQ